MSSPRPSWRPLLAGTIALFLVILAFLAGQVRAGADPALGRGAQETTPQSTPAPGGSSPDESGSDGSGPDGFVPGGSAPAPPTPNGSAPDSPSPSSDAPTTQQS